MGSRDEKTKGRTELTASGLATYLTDDFRVYEPRTCRTDRGTVRTYRLWKVLVRSGSEGFVSVLSEEPDSESFFGQDEDGGDTLSVD